MKARQLQALLISNGFREERQDSGYNYTKTAGHIELECYIEPNIEIEFITFYKWKNNEIKGRYNISVKDLEKKDFTIKQLFLNTLQDIPKYVGDTVDVHSDVATVVNDLFG